MRSPSPPPAPSVRRRDPALHVLSTGLSAAYAIEKGVVLVRVDGTQQRFSLIMTETGVPAAETPFGAPLDLSMTTGRGGGEVPCAQVTGALGRAPDAIWLLSSCLLGFGGTSVLRARDGELRVVGGRSEGALRTEASWFDGKGALVAIDNLVEGVERGPSLVVRSWPSGKLDDPFSRGEKLPFKLGVEGASLSPDGALFALADIEEKRRFLTSAGHVQRRDAPPTVGAVTIAAPLLSVKKGLLYAAATGAGGRAAVARVEGPTTSLVKLSLEGQVVGLKAARGGGVVALVSGGKGAWVVRLGEGGAEAFALGEADSAPELLLGPSGGVWVLSGVSGSRVLLGMDEGARGARVSDDGQGAGGPVRGGRGDQSP